MAKQFWEEDICGGCVQLEKENDGLQEEIERLRASVNEGERQLCYLSCWLEERFGVDSNAVIGDLPYPPEKTLARVIVKTIDENIERLSQLYREARQSECGWELSDRFEYETQHLPDCQAWIQQFDEETERRLREAAEAAGGE